MKIYNYSYEDNTYTGESVADESPLQNGVYLIPAMATTTQPQEYGDYEIPMFEGGVWIIKKDYRGVALYSKDTGEVIYAELGQTLEDLGATLVERPDDTYVWEESVENWVKDETKVLDKLKNEITNITAKLMEIANLKISIYQDSYDLGIASDKEKLLLKAWKEYRVLLNRIPLQETYPKSVLYPTLPE